MLARLHVVISSELEDDFEMIKQLLLEIYPNFSISASREYPYLNNHSDFYITCDLNEEEVQPLLDKLNNDWDGEKDDCVCYGFNTRMFHKLVYCLEFTLFND